MRHKHPLRVWRKERGISADDLARNLNLAPATIISYENGTRSISAERAIYIESILGIDREILRPDLFKRAA